MTLKSSHRAIGRRLMCAGLAFSPTLGWTIAAGAQSSDPKFAAWLLGVKAEALKAGVDEATAEAALGGNVEQIPRVLELAHNQPEFTMTFDRYMELVVSPKRVTDGRAALKANRALIERFAGPAGVPPSIVASFWGIESNYGEKQGDFEVIPALATLAYNNFRASFFRQQLIAALKIVSQGHIALHAMKGSWAGAMGQPQFIPTTFLLYAADGDGDGRYDIWNSKADVFATTVNHLTHIGWKPGIGWGAEVESTAVAGKGERIVRPSGAGGPAYRTTANFQAILRWNQSDFFALAVGILSDRIAA